MSKERVLSAEETREMLQLDAAMFHHIRYNHYPPPPNVEAIKRTCIQIVRRFNGMDPDSEPDHNLDYMVDTPSGKQVSAQELVDAFHLHDFLEWDE